MNIVVSSPLKDLQKLAKEAIKVKVTEYVRDEFERVLLPSILNDLEVRLQAEASQMIDGEIRIDFNLGKSEDDRPF